VSIADYFAREDAERVLLLHIQRSDAPATCYRISDAPYATVAGDTPANVLYSPIIGGSGMPELRRTLNDPFEGGASTSFGQITFTSPEANYTTGAGAQGTAVMVLPRGAVITAKVAAPREMFPLADALTLAIGKLNRASGSSEGELSVEIIDRSEFIAKQPINIDPEQGPRCFGYVRNFEAMQLSAADLLYAVNAGPIESIEAVYDDGVLLDPTDWTADLAAGRFTLTGSAVGKISADVKGAKFGGVWAASTQAILAGLLAEAGVTIAQSYDLPTGTVGYAVTSHTTLGEVFNALTRGCAGYWLVNRLDTFVAAQYPLPVGGDEFTEAQLLSEVQRSVVDRLISKVNFAYRKNWTKYKAKDGATDAQSTFAAGDGLTDSVSITPAAEYVYDPAPDFITYFDQLSDAQGVAERLLDLYGVERQELTAVVPYRSALDIGSSVTLTFDGASYDCAVTSVVDVFDGNFPVQRITVIA
jgi:hypothetical protein